MDLTALFALHVSPSLVAIGFSVVLVLSLVAAEEAELRRRGRAGDAGA